MLRLFRTPPAEGSTEEELEPRYAWWLRSRFATWFLAFISFIESVFAPILIDPFLIALTMAHQERWRWYIAVSVTASVVGGIVAYYLGALFFDTVGTQIIEFYNLEERFANLAAQADANGFVFVLLGAFTPIPYKLVALASGLLQINILTFIVASIVGRFLRLGLVGLAAHYAGPHMLPMVRRNLFTIAAATGIVLAIYIAYQIFW